MKWLTLSPWYTRLRNICWKFSFYCSK